MIREGETEELGRGYRQPLPAILISLVVHVLLMITAALRLLGHEPRRADEPPVVPAELGTRVQMPTADELRRLLGSEPPTRPPTPAPPKPKQRISIGPPSDRQAKEIWLERDKEIASTARGDGAEGPGPQPQPAMPTRAPTVKTSDSGFTEPSRSILGSLRQFDKKLEQGGSGLGLGKAGPQHADIAYDPQGADFSEWVDHLRRELYRNWIIPQAAIMGFRGRVVVRFVVGRDGTLLRGDIPTPSGTVSLDRAAKNAVIGSRMRPLPADYGPEELELAVTFHY